MNKLIILLLLTYTVSSFSMANLTTKALRSCIKSKCKVSDMPLKSYSNKNAKNSLYTYKVLNKNEFIRKYTSKVIVSNNKKKINKYNNVGLKRKLLKHAIEKIALEINREKRRDFCEQDEQKNIMIDTTIIKAHNMIIKLLLMSIFGYHLII